MHVLNLAPAAAKNPDAERILGCLFGGAVGDAFGYEVEFDDLPAIRRRFGSAGITAPVFDQGRFIVSDDTQMTLFTGESVAAALAAGETADDRIIPAIRAGYLTWLETQTRGAQGCGAFEDVRRFRTLWARRAPGNTCQSALQAGGRGTPKSPINNSKGCGGVMRVAPIGLARAIDADGAYHLAGAAAALTHGHPSGYLSAAALGGIIRDLLDGDDLSASLRNARTRLEHSPDHA